MNLTVLSFNTQHCRNFISGSIDFEKVAKLIQKLDADIVGLNEIRGKGPINGYEAQMEKLAELTGYHYHFAPAILVEGVGPYGNGLLSRYPIKFAETVMIPDPKEKKGRLSYETRCVLKATVDVGDGLTVLVTHFGLNDDEHVNAVKTVVPLFERQRCVFMGDLNTLPGDKVLNEINERLFDTAKLFDREKLSFPSDNPTCKIDYVFTSPDISVSFADIPAEIVSDHRPYIVKISI